MRIVSSYRPHGIRLDKTKISSHSIGILFMSLYCAGLVIGCSVYITAGTFRLLADRILLEAVIPSAPLSELVTILTVTALGAGTFVFWTGLSLIGGPCLYLFTLFTGALSGIVEIACCSNNAPFWFIKCIFLQPFYALSVCFLLSMCENAFSMSASIRLGEKNDQELTKKYAVRIIILTALMILGNITVSLLIVLLRHFS